MFYYYSIPPYISTGYYCLNLSSINHGLYLIPSPGGTLSTSSSHDRRHILFTPGLKARLYKPTPTDSWRLSESTPFSLPEGSRPIQSLEATETWEVEKIYAHPQARLSNCDSIFPFAMFGIMVFVIIKSDTTKDIIRNERGPWPKHKKLWPSIMLLAGAAFTLVLSLIAAASSLRSEAGNSRWWSMHSISSHGRSSHSCIDTRKAWMAGRVIFGDGPPQRRQKLFNLLSMRCWISKACATSRQVINVIDGL